MQIGFIGYGGMAKALASRWAGHHPIAIGGPNSEKARALAEELSRGSRSGTSADVVRDSQVVVLATCHEGAFAAMDTAGGPSAFAGKALIDINNSVAGIYDGE
jgi:predicted dinucleotide-binding enzyme